MTRRRGICLISVGLACGVALAAPPLAAQDVCPQPWPLTETLRIGSIDGPDALTDPSALETGPDGRVYVIQSMLSAVSIFEPDGTPDGILGRAGGGPGEFSMFPHSLGWMADTLWVADVAQVHFYSRDGSALRTVRFRTPVPEEGSVFVPGPPLTDGSFLGSRHVNDYPRYTARPFLEELRFSETGDVLDTIARVDRRGRYVRYEDRGRAIEVEHPLTHWLNIPGEYTIGAGVPAHDGSGVIVVGPSRETASGSSFDLLHLGFHGDTLLKRRIDYNPRPITRAQQARLREWFGAKAAGEYRPPAAGNLPSSSGVPERTRRAAEDAITFPGHHPPVRRVVSGADGTIWLLREMRPDDVDRWEVYGPSGELEGSVEVKSGRSALLPWAPHLRLLRATRDEVWGATMDDLDVPYVHRYAVDRSCR